ncbi:MAG: hypothetical protein U0524_03415 [Candidatus Saccharimonadales bacterium]
MVDKVERVTEVRNGNSDTQEVRRVTEEHTDGSTLAARIIWYIAGVILVLLAFRFVLILLGANRSNGFADFIFSTTNPLVAPFYGLFGYDLQYGVAKFEIYTLIAMAVYALIAYGLARLVTIGNPRRTSDV